MSIERMRYLSVAVVAPQPTPRVQRRIADLFHAFFDRLRRPAWRIEVTYAPSFRTPGAPPPPALAGLVRPPP